MSTALHPQTAGALSALPPVAPAPPRPAGAAAGSPRWQTEQLFGPRSEVEIEHRGSIYRLRITSLGKLILTK
ncbi:MAG: hemin uptake protein HemP [Rubrivivax sp.]